MTHQDRAASAPQRIEAAQRASRAVALRAAGGTFPEIAEQLGYPSPDAARKAIERAVAGQRNAAVEQLRAVEGQRLEELWERVTDLLDREATPSALMAAVRISQRRARLFGLDAPEEVRVEQSTPSSEIRELQTRFLALIRPEHVVDGDVVDDEADDEPETEGQEW